MKKKVLFFLPFLLIILTINLIFSCKKVDKKDDSVVMNEVKKDEVVEKKDEKTQVTKEEKVEDKKIDDRFVFTITDDLKKDDLDKRIRALFIAIEDKIANGDFDGWYNALSYKNRKYISDKANLLKMSKESDYLYSRNIILETPKDYFLHIVVPSRKGSVLKYVGYDFIDKEHIKVNCMLDDLRFGYDFIYEDGAWKVDRK